MKRISALSLVLVLGLCTFGAAGCSGGESSGCGPTEEQLDQEAQGATNTNTVTCGPGTHLEGNTCVRNSSQQATTLSN